MNPPTPTNRRDFLKGAALATSALALPTFGYTAPTPSTVDVPRRAEEKALYLGFFDPAEGHMPNPGLGAASATFRWPTNTGTGFTLQENSNLTTSSWSAVPATPVISGSNSSVTLPLSDTNLFFRLAQ